MAIWRSLLLCLVLFSTAVSAQPAHNISVRIETETRSPQPGGKATIAFAMTPKQGWHDYWINPGDAGGPLTVEWSLPSGVTAGPLQFPVPTPLNIGGFMNHVYEAPHAIIADLTVASSVPAGTKLPIAVKAMWFACSDRLCVPEEARFVVDLVAGDKATASQPRFDAWRAALPSPLDRSGRYRVSGKSFVLAVPFPRGATTGPVYFFPETKDIFRYAAAQTARRSGDWLIVESEVERPPVGAIAALLRIGENRGLSVRATSGTIPKGGDQIAVVPSGGDGEAGQGSPALPLLLLGALLGGLLLNIMPCVFPILGLKALSLAKAGNDEHAARSDALSYSAGVILSTLALGALMLALRAGGEQIGWAFQLQSPGFVLFLLLLMVAVTANLAGLFALPALGGSGRYGSFGTGVLAALVATPCTGPFMAAAMGAALLLPVAQALALFAALGLGLALPFLALAYIPPLRNRLPKAGPWLERFRQAMAVPMALTALALLWLLWRLSGTAGLAVGAVTSMLLILTVLIRGKGANPQKLGLIAVVFGLLAVSGPFFLPDEPAERQSRTKRLIPTIPFSETKLAQLRAEGKPVFLYFTADWCITCKVNEASAIQTEATAKAFAEAGVVLMEGDFTRRDPAIAGFLTRHGRSGVPLYLWYAPGKDRAELPQLLTEGMLDAFAKGGVF
jgi:DsbC/DsbD-like thiol-disulfide interchange protein/cytochrome c biogenesis protein CcdA